MCVFLVCLYFYLSLSLPLPPSTYFHGMARGEVPEEESWMEGPISKEEVSLQVDKNFPESWADPATVLCMANPEFSEEAVDTGSCVNRVGGRATSIMQLTKLGFLGPVWRLRTQRRRRRAGVSPLARERGKDTRTQGWKQTRILCLRCLSSSQPKYMQAHVYT